MPELPEVETVRAGLATRLPGRTVVGVEVHHPRAVRRPAAGLADGPPSLFGPCGVAMMMKRWPVPLLSPCESRLETLRNHRVM